MIFEPDLAAAVNATQAIIGAREQRRDAEQIIQEQRRVQRDAIYHLYHDAHLSSEQIEERLRAELRGRGLTEEQVRRTGISHDSVERIVGTRANPKPRPNAD